MKNKILISGNIYDVIRGWYHNLGGKTFTEGTKADKHVSDPPSFPAILPEHHRSELGLLEDIFVDETKNHDVYNYYEDWEDYSI